MTIARAILSDRLAGGLWAALIALALLFNAAMTARATAAAGTPDPFAVLCAPAGEAPATGIPSGHAADCALLCQVALGSSLALLPASAAAAVEHPDPAAAIAAFGNDRHGLTARARHLIAQPRAPPVSA